MTIAIWIIAVCEIIRAAQNMLQVNMILQEKGIRENAYAELIKSLHASDREFVMELLEEYERTKEQP